MPGVQRARVACASPPFATCNGSSLRYRARVFDAAVAHLRVRNPPGSAVAPLALRDGGEPAACRACKLPLQHARRYQPTFVEPGAPLVLMVDNYDSFTFNIVQYLLELGAVVDVVANDACDLADIVALAPSHVVLSPGFGTPAHSGVCRSICRWALEGSAPPVLGVCLGHQALCEAGGAVVSRADRVVHGKASRVEHAGHDLFAGVPSPFRAGRYHSLVVAASTLGRDFEAIAWTSAGELMAVAHRQLLVFGVQYHPESVLTEHGHVLLGNFLAMGGTQHGHGSVVGGGA